MTPRMTVGLPVYGDGKYLREAGEFVLGPTFEDFERVVSGTASTDGPALCAGQAFVAKLTMAGLGT